VFVMIRLLQYTGGRLLLSWLVHSGSSFPAPMFNDVLFCSVGGGQLGLALAVATRHDCASCRGGSVPVVIMAVEEG
jgi:hypothetical protein